MSVTITRLPNVLKPLAHGVVKADGTEQTLVEYVGIGVVKGYIDLSEMEDGDEVIVAQYVRVDKQTGWKRYAREVYTDKQEDPALYITPKPCDYALKITLQQTKGNYRSFIYNIMVQE